MGGAKLSLLETRTMKIIAALITATAINFLFYSGLAVILYLTVRAIATMLVNLGVI